MEWQVRRRDGDKNAVDVDVNGGRENDKYNDVTAMKALMMWMLTEEDDNYDDAMSTTATSTHL